MIDRVGVQCAAILLVAGIGCSPVDSVGRESDGGTGQTDSSTSEGTSGSGGTSTDESSGDSTADPPAEWCEQNAAAGRGIAYVGEAEPGVWCGDQLCGGCCFHGNLQCQPSPDDDCGGVAMLCDGAEDCDDGAVCCYQPGVPVYACVPSEQCVEPGIIVCRADDECGAGSCVRGPTVNGALDLGVCQAEMPSACVAEPFADCGGADLHGFDLRGVDLHGAQLCSADLSRASLVAADLREASLVGVDLSDSVLDDADLRGADLQGADLRGSNLTFTRLEGADVRGVVMAQIRGHELHLDGADLSGVSFEGAHVFRSSLVGVDLRNADLRSSLLSELDLTGALLDGARFEDAQLVNVICPDGTEVTGTPCPDGA